MKVTFDPAEERRILDGDTGYEWALARTFEEVYAKNALTHVAHANLTDAIQCILVSYDEPADRLARRAQEWLTIAVQQDEQTQRFPIAHKAQRHFDLALCAWLLRGECDEDNLRIFVETKNEHYASQGDLDRVDVSFGVVNFLDVGDHRATLDLLLRAGIGPPASFDAIRTEAQMAYVLCRKRLGEAYDDADVDGALRAFLKRNVNAWLIDGHYMRTGLWMKVSHWSEDDPLSPQETVRKAYDYLPGVTPPVL
jgi:hypothetical protein